MDRVAATTELKYPQQNHLIVSFRYIDKLLSDVEQMVDCAASNCLFPRFLPDLDPEEAREIFDFIKQFREKMRDSLERLAGAIPAAQITASHAIETNLDFVDVAVTEIRSHHMHAYGETTPEAAKVLDSIADELQQILRALLEKMRQRSSGRQ